ncbi:MAG: hypothetical protein IKV41_02110 [Oscillospiraceae bacterium]|nr:hypothetical protein [Oscillospiraceae bacterium]
MSFALTALLMVCGCVFLTEQFLTWLWKPDDIPEFIFVIPLKGKVENAEQIVRYHDTWIKWNTMSRNYRIVLLDDGMDEETVKQCELLVRENSVMSMVKR